MLTHLSTVITAVIQLLTRVKAKCGIPETRYATSMYSNGTSAAIKAGVKKMHDQTIVMRLHKSETDKPADKNIYKRFISQCALYKNNN